MRPKDVVRALDEQTSEIDVARLRDAELRIAVPGLAASRSQDLRVNPCVSRELLGINLIALAVAMRDRPQLTHVRYDDLVSKFLKLLADPDRMSPASIATRAG